uniref:Sialate O-acetylesterase n=1 Tax=Acidobacterium capsulatum TaxID=33075 RepID=A0A7V5CU06_9BACT
MRFRLASLCRLLLVLTFCLMTAATARAELRLPHMLSSHAVLQRGRPIHVWGWSDADETVTVKFHGQTQRATANRYGQWELWLQAEKAGGPYEMTVSGSRGEAPIVLNDLLVGDVWFASGQSNMQIPLIGFPGSAVIKNAKEEIAQANHPQIRLLFVPLKSSPYPLDDQSGTWTQCTPETARTFSAVAYFFARDLQRHLHVPIGIVDATWGGTPIESWMSLKSLASDAGFMPVFMKRAEFAAQQTNLKTIVAQEKAEDAKAVAAGKPKPEHPWHPDQQSWNPSYLYNAMIAPETPYTIRGFLWYQGETNSDDAWVPSLYQRLFSAMIEDWRTRWHEGTLPFLYVQISSFYSPQEHWGEIRNAQRLTLALRNTGMAVSLDKGLRNNIHPPDKQTVSHRLALAAYHLAYGEDGTWEGPLFEQVTREGDALRVFFSFTKGLHAEGDAVRSFEVESADRRWHAAHATLDGDTVLVRADGVSAPMAVRYGWASYTDANLYNGAGLPASTFEAQVP